MQMKGHAYMGMGEAGVGVNIIPGQNDMTSWGDQ